MKMHAPPGFCIDGGRSFSAVGLEGFRNDVGMKTDPPLEAHSDLSSTSGPDYYGEEFQCGFYAKVFYRVSSWAFNSAAKW